MTGRRGQRAHEIDVYVGARMRQQRIAAGKSQQECAKACGLSFQQMQKYEKGINRIAPARLYMLAKLLGVDVNYFFDGYDNTDPPRHEDGRAAGAQIRRDLSIARAVKDIPSSDVQNKMIALAQAISKMAEEADGG